MYSIPYRQYTGPHGAGLTNMLFAPKDVSLIEFSMTPHVNRCFGYMAMSLDIDYWLVPQVWGFTTLCVWHASSR